MNIKQLREQAIKRYKNGESIKEIYQNLGKDKTWFFKYLKRYKLDSEDWVKGRACKPYKSPKRIDKMTEQTTIETIKHLEKILYSRIRTLAISYGLNQQGKESPPIINV